MLNATSNIKLQIWQLDAPTLGQGTLLLHGTKLQQALMQDWEMQSNRLDCWARQKETKRMSDKKGKKKEWEENTQNTNTFNIHSLCISELKVNRVWKQHLSASLTQKTKQYWKPGIASKSHHHQWYVKNQERRTLVTAVTCKIQINQFNLQQTQLGSELQWRLACAPLM